MLIQKRVGSNDFEILWLIVWNWKQIAHAKQHPQISNQNLSITKTTLSLDTTQDEYPRSYLILS